MAVGLHRDGHIAEMGRLVIELCQGRQTHHQWFEHLTDMGPVDLVAANARTLTSPLAPIR